MERNQDDKLPGEREAFVQLTVINTPWLMSFLLGTQKHREQKIDNSVSSQLSKQITLFLVIGWSGGWGKTRDKIRRTLIPGKIKKFTLT